MEGPLAACRNHGHEGTCTRCGSFVCEACRRWVNGEPYCQACHETVPRGPSRRAIAALACSALGLCLVLPGIVGIVLGLLELRAIRERRAPEAGRDYVTPAISLGVLELVVVLLGAYRLLVLGP